MDFKKLFNTMHPDFFEGEVIKNLPSTSINEELVMALADFDGDKFDIKVPENITFGYYTGDLNKLHEAVGSVLPSWVKLYKPDTRVFCGFDGDKIASFCIVEDMGEYTENGVTYKIGGPGCVGTLHEYRKQGIGLMMVKKATEILRDMGYDIGYIHFTQVGHWYAHLGYKVCLRWNREGIISSENISIDAK